MNGQTSQPIVLVVEDNSLVRVIIADFLESAGFVVIQAVDGAAPADQAASISRRRVTTFRLS